MRINSRARASREQADRGELAPLAAEAIRTPIAATYRDSPGSVWGEHIND